MARKIPDPLIERLKIAGQLAVRAKIFYDIWRCYHDELNEEREFHDTVNLYTEFFRFDFHAHLMCFVVSFAALLERRDDTINLDRVVKDVLDVAALSAKEKTDIKALLSKVLQLRVPIMTLRNNAFAHRSASLSYNSAFRKAQVTPNQLKELGEQILELTNRLQVACNLKDTISNAMAVTDLREMVAALYKQHLAE